MELYEMTLEQVLGEKRSVVAKHVESPGVRVTLSRGLGIVRISIGRTDSFYDPRELVTTEVPSENGIQDALVLAVTRWLDQNKGSFAALLAEETILWLEDRLRKDGKL